ncbi:MAG: hypothetical protein LBS79_04550 [Tannerella sp.]|jgi:hypothetical protein|nr:hypothetical protein [Tannerella sp.]
MEKYRKPKIEFYRRRTFSEKMNATFDFIRENWKPLLKYTFYLIMPVCLVQTFAMNSFISGYIELLSSAGGGGTLFSANSTLVHYGVLMLCSLVGSAIIAGMVYALMQTYATRADGLAHITLDDFKENLVRNIWKILFISLFLIFILSAIILAATFLAVVVSTISLFITIPLIFLCLLLLLPLMMIVPVFIFERDIRFSDAVKKAWRLGMSALGGMLALIFVLGVISSVIQTVTMLPWYITIVFGNLFSLSAESPVTQSVVFKFAVYILGLIQTYGMYVSSTIGTIGLAFHYFHVREKVEGVSIDSNISNFSNL